MIDPLRLLLLAAVLLSPLAVRAETHATCAGFIDSVPVVINSQGTWCLRHDLSTAIATGGAIEIAANNVTIDCNSFKLGGLAAGAASQTMGILAIDRQNLTVRNCNVRGFYIGMYVRGGVGHLLEDNRIDNSLLVGISLDADGGLTRRNRVFDTGGSSSYPSGIIATGDILDNVVAGILGGGTDSFPDGIFQYSGSGGLIQNNRVSGLVATGAGTARGVGTFGNGTRVQGNHITAAEMTPGIGVYAWGTATFCLENTVSNFATPLDLCERSVGNLSLPGP